MNKETGSERGRVSKGPPLPSRESRTQTRVNRPEPTLISSSLPRTGDSPSPSLALPQPAGSVHLNHKVCVEAQL